MGLKEEDKNKRKEERKKERRREKREEEVLEDDVETRRPLDVSNYIHEESLKLHESRCKVYLYPECITLTHTLL